MESAQIKDQQEAGIVQYVQVFVSVWSAKGQGSTHSVDMISEYD